MHHPTLAFIGFGEAAQAFVEGWDDDRRRHVTAHDVKTGLLEQQAAKRADYRRCRVQGCERLDEALAAAEVVVSVVTADRALEAALAAAGHLEPGALFLDMNSIAPAAKLAAAAAIDRAQGRYVDVAVMAPVRPAGLAVPLLVSGPHADDGAAVLRELGFAPRIVTGPVGAASSIKMIRSIMIKGLEALTAECVLSAHAAGVEDEVLASLDASFPGGGWRERADYNLDRMLVHGRRRGEEMLHVAATARSLGQSGIMAEAAAEWQDRLGRLSLSPPPEGLAAKADAILAATGVSR